MEAAIDRAEEPIHGRRGTIRGTYNPRLRRFYSLRRPPMKAHELLNSAEAWCQESPAEDRQGNKLQALDPRAVKWCALGAIQRAYPVSQWGEAMDRLLRALSVSEPGLAQMNKSDKACSLMEWNDNRRNSFLDVRQILLFANI
jgi:hypothetical protein